MKIIDIEKWSRREQYLFFKEFSDPYFSAVIPFDVAKAYNFSKTGQLPFFVVYLHACMKALNSVENFRYRIREDNKVIVHDIIHASATISRPDFTFGFSFIGYDDDIYRFHRNFEAEKERIHSSNTLFPPQYSDNCIYCSALPWFDFTGYKEAFSGDRSDSVPRLAFGKYRQTNDKYSMSVSVTVHHALVDGYHLGLFVNRFQDLLNQY